MSKFIDIVFDGPPEAEAGRFIEVEDPNRAGVRVGTWVDRMDGTWALRITPADAERALYDMPRQRGWYFDRYKQLVYVDGDRYNRPGQHPLKDFHFVEVAPFTRLVEEQINEEEVK